MLLVTDIMMMRVVTTGTGHPDHDTIPEYPQLPCPVPLYT